MPISRSIEHTDIGVMPPRKRVTPPEPEQAAEPPVEEPVVEEVIEDAPDKAEPKTKTTTKK